MTHATAALFLLLLAEPGAGSSSDSERLPSLNTGPPAIALAVAPAPSNDLRLELARNNAQRHTFMNVLGERRWRELDEARFQVQLHSFDFKQALWEDPNKQSRVEDALLDGYVKVMREDLERRLRVDDRIDAYFERLWSRVTHTDYSEDTERDALSSERDSLGVRVSPRLNLGGNTRLGAKLRFKARQGSPLSNLSLRLRHDFDDSDFGFKLGFQDKDRDLYLEYRSNDRYQGELIELNVRLSF